jgi:hypothetical protein
LNYNFFRRIREDESRPTKTANIRIKNSALSVFKFCLFFSPPLTAKSPKFELITEKKEQITTEQIRIQSIGSKSVHFLPVSSFRVNKSLKPKTGRKITTGAKNPIY